MRPDPAPAWPELPTSLIWGQYSTGRRRRFDEAGDDCAARSGAFTRGNERAECADAAAGRRTGGLLRVGPALRRSCRTGHAPDPSMPSHEVAAILRSRGFLPMSGPVRRGEYYIVTAMHESGERGRVVINAFSGRFVEFVPASQVAVAPRRDEMVLVYQGPTFPPPGVSRIVPPPPPPPIARGVPRPPAAIPRVASRTPPVSPKPRPQSAPQRPETPRPRTRCAPRPRCRVPRRTRGRPEPRAPAHGPPARRPPESSPTTEFSLPVRGDPAKPDSLT